MTDETKMNAVCKRCGRLLSEDEPGADKERSYCGSCMIELAEEHIPEAPERPQIKREKRSRVWLVVQVTIIVAAVAIMALQAPRFISAVKGDRPLRYGTCATDAQTDQCIKNLWHISRMLQDGKATPSDMVCPISKKPYEIRDTGADVIVSCPNPELHGCKELQVRKRRPVPEISK